MCSRVPPATTGTGRGVPLAVSCSPQCVQEEWRNHRLSSRAATAQHLVWGFMTEAACGTAHPHPAAVLVPWVSPGAGAVQGLCRDAPGKSAWLWCPGRAGNAHGSCAGCPWRGPQRNCATVSPQGSSPPLLCPQWPDGVRKWGWVPGHLTGDAGAVPLHLQLGSAPSRDSGRAPACHLLHTCSWHRAAIYNQPAV